jgi:hypothetical protein
VIRNLTANLVHESSAVIYNLSAVRQLQKRALKELRVERIFEEKAAAAACDLIRRGEIRLK